MSTETGRTYILGYQKIIVRCLEAGRARVISATFGLIGVVALADWLVGNSVSLGVLYVFPMMLGAIVLRRFETLGLAVLCSVLRWRFDTPGSAAEEALRSAFAVVAYFSAGLFVTALVSNRQLVADSLSQVQEEQTLRHEAETQLRLLVESSPAAIVTADRRGTVLAANAAANQMFAVGEGNTLRGRNIGTYLPVLGDALALNVGGDAFRTAAQCQGRRENGEIFLAHTWFSSHGTEDKHISAIVVDSSEEMRDREEQNLSHLLHYNRITAAALAHEVRNISAAIGVVSANLNEKLPQSAEEDYQGLIRLTRGLEKLAVLNLSSYAEQTVDAISLQPILDNLRIIIEPEWTEIGGTIHWPATEHVPKVMADPNGLLQSLLNLVQNSYRAAQTIEVKELVITIEATGIGSIVIFVRDSGPGVRFPDRLFRPFEAEADGTGLGLYISRAIVRSFGGELRFEPQETGCCFAIELPVGN